MRHQHKSLSAGLAFVLVSATTPAPGASAQTSSDDHYQFVAAQTDDPDLKQFIAAVENYVMLQRSLRKEVGDLLPKSDAAAITEASDLLAVAIQRARPSARQGDFFTPVVREAMQRRVREALAHVNFAAITGLDDPEERSSIRLMRTYARFPEEGPLATMPPSVLVVLPALPEELEYRFVGKDLILRDRLARLVLDYMTIVVPAR